MCQSETVGAQGVSAGTDGAWQSSQFLCCNFVLYGCSSGRAKEKCQVLSIIFGTGATICWKTYLWTNGHHQPWSISHSHLHTALSTSAIGQTFSGSHVLWWCLALPAMLLESSVECQTDDLSNFSSSFGNSAKLQGAKSGKYGGWGTAILCFGKKVLVTKDLWQSMLSWCSSQFPWCQSLGSRCYTFSRSHHKTSQ